MIEEKLGEIESILLVIMFAIVFVGSLYTLRLRDILIRERKQ